MAKFVCYFLVAEGVVSWTDVCVNMSLEDVNALFDTVVALRSYKEKPDGR